MTKFRGIPVNIRFGAVFGIAAAGCAMLMGAPDDVTIATLITFALIGCLAQPDMLKHVDH